MFAAGLLASLFASASAATREFEWSLSWKTVNPDGLHDRQVVAINDEWPLPVVRVKQGDRVIVNVTNNLDDPAYMSTIHFHGLFQNGTNDMDGPPMVTQCPNVLGSSFVYNFTVDQPGTYWYHAHVENLYPDGYRQLFLVDEDDAWFEDKVDDEIAFTLTDWYHEIAQVISDGKFMTLYNPSGAEPVPKSLLMNDTVAPKFEVLPDRTYRLRIANIGAFAGFYFYIPGYKMTIVEVDGVYTEPAEAELIYISAAQRYSVLLHTSKDPNEIYQMVQIADKAMFDIVPSDLQLNHTGFLYAGKHDEKEFVQADHEFIFNTAPVSNLTDNSEIAGVADDLSLDTFTSDNLHWFDDFDLVPYDHEPLLEPVSVNHTLTLTMSNLYDGKPYAFFNDKTFTAPKVPTLFSVLSAPSDEVANNSTIYGSNTNTYVLNHMDIVQLILNNEDTGKHPFHMHGHNFQVVLRAPDMGGEDDDYTPYDPAKDAGDYPKIPMKRDTVVVMPNSHFLLRFRADNPGVWFFHCHIDWHMTQGLSVLLVEAPVQIRQNYKVHSIADSHASTCKAAGLPMRGNAAANLKNFFDLTGENLQMPYLPSTFTYRGVVALIFSIVCAFTGMGFLCWFGSTDTTAAEDVFAEQVIERAELDAVAESEDLSESVATGSEAQLV